MEWEKKTDEASYGEWEMVNIYIYIQGIKLPLKILKEAINQGN